MLLLAVLPLLRDLSVELYGILDVESLDLPGASLIQPIVRDFHLVAVLDQLLEDSVAVPDTVPEGGVVQGGQ